MADERQINIFEMRLKRRGYCLSDLVSKEEFIFIKRGLDSLKLHETIAHEIYHAIYSDNETEANIFRLIAIIPKPALMSFDWLEENPGSYAWKLWRERERVYFLYGV